VSEDRVWFDPRANEWLTDQEVGLDRPGLIAYFSEYQRERMDAELIEKAAKVMDDRVRTETDYAEKHKATGKHYKAREAAHVARIAAQDAVRIRGLK
jgi:hypothetical protein